MFEMIAAPMGETKPAHVRVDLDRWIKLKFHGTGIIADGGLPAIASWMNALAYRHGAHEAA